ncbi:T9SS type A sorting domain-containing protein [Portibacter marinus]|uniref:T9SS type A sorting domain-containing protein n=1 Tax=Portibacter marinus TaxID=2898660 RepID=UPI001F1A2D65|nr:T9SS type A sorting domain-containing protein [Portibacter marinus]
MKKNFALLSLITILLIGVQLQITAQCTDFLEEPIESFGSAPIVIAGCPQYNEINDFEVYAAEAYIVENFVMGQEYAFNICNGESAGSWIPEFTIQAPSGAIDAFGAGDGDSCTITWTATENGTYLIIINEAGQCGGGENTGSDNGYPTLEIIADASNCDTSICLQWQEPSGFSGYSNFNTSFGGAPLDFGGGCDTFTVEIAVWAAEGYALDNVQVGGSYAFNICEGTGAGTWIPEFTIISPNGNIDAFGHGDGDGCSISWTASESGTYIIVINEAGQCGGGENTQTDNGFPSITCTGGVFVECSVGTVVSERGWTVCGDLDSFAVEVANAVIPEGGGIGYGFAPGTDGTGGNGTGFAITNSTTDVLFDNDINGVLSSNGLDKLRGTWMISPFTYTDAENAVASRCDVSTETITVFFNDNIELTVEEIGGGQAVVSANGGAAPYTFTWSDPMSQMTDTLSVEADGEYQVTVTDELGCTEVASVNITTTSLEQIVQLEKWSIAPNPTNGILNVSVNLLSEELTSLQILDLTGRIIDHRKFTTSQLSEQFDMSESAPGMYLLKLNVDGKINIRKFIVAQ